VAVKPLKYILVRDLSPGNSKGGVVPANRIWTVVWGHVKFTSTATPGSRMIVMRAKLPGDPRPLARTWASEVQSPNTIHRYQLFPGGATTPGEHMGSTIYMPLPAVPVMLEGWEFSIYDETNSDPNDHMELRALVVLEQKQ